VFLASGVPGRAYGESSTFHLLFGQEGTVDAAALKNGVPPGPVSAALHCSMLSEGVHLFHGSGFLSAAHGEREAEQTVRALATTLRRLQAAGLV
jgi:glutamate-1-semialdehyde aminotransferase